MIRPWQFRLDHSYLCMTLQRSTRFLVNVDNNTVRIAGEIHSWIDDDFGHFLVDFGLYGVRMSSSGRIQLSNLFLWLGFLDIRLQLPRNGSYFVEESEFTIIECSGISRKGVDDLQYSGIEHRLHRILLVVYKSSTFS